MVVTKISTKEVQVNLDILQSDVAANRNPGLVASSTNCILLDRWTVGDVHLQVKQWVVGLVVVDHEYVVVWVVKLVVVVGLMVGTVAVDEDQRCVRVVDPLGHLAGRLLLQNTRRNRNHCCFRAREPF